MARRKRPIDKELLDKSGIADFESELENFLSSYARLKAVFQSVAENLIEYVSDAHHKIVNQNASLDAPLDQIELRYKNAKKRLDELEKRTNKVNEIILNAGKDIAQTAVRDFDYYTSKLKDNWDQDSKEIINLDEIVGEKDECEIRSVTLREQNKYIAIKLKQWNDQFGVSIKRDIYKLEDDLNKELGYIELNITQIESSFFSGTELGGKDLENENDRIEKMVHITCDSAKMEFDISSVPVPGDGLFGAMRAGLVFAGPGFLYGGLPGALAGFVLGTALGYNSKNKNQELLLFMKKSIFERGLTETKINIGPHFEVKFKLIAQYYNKLLTGQIIDVNSNMERIIKERKDADYSYNNEKERLQAISDLIVNRFNIVYSSAYGKTLTLEDIYQEARRKKGTERDTLNLHPAGESGV